jgi:inhibitor of KinA
MTTQLPKIKPLGESAVVVEFGEVISEELNDRAISMANELNSRPFLGFIESFPSYSSTTIFYDLLLVRKSFPEFLTTFSAVESLLQKRLSTLIQEELANNTIVEIPVDFSSQSGLDLESVAISCGITVNEVIQIFTSRTYRVYMIGFLPGFPYMGEVDERIRLPRRQQPRLKVPKGSVGIAGSQTGVYPLETPGGWQILGRTEIEFFLPSAASPSLLKPTDRVRFVAL